MEVFRIRTGWVDERGALVVVAAGNDGPTADSLQFLARSPHAISVGATDEKQELLDTSSRGVPGESRPTVVANGQIDWLDPKCAPYATSWAAPRVSTCVAWLKLLMMLIAQDVTMLAGGSWSGVQRLGVPRIAFCDTGNNDTEVRHYIVPQLTRSRRQADWYQTVGLLLNEYRLTYNIYNTPAQVTRALISLAQPMRGRERYEVGAGFVYSDAYVQFARNLRPAFWLKIICEPEDLSRLPQLRLVDIDSLRPLWDDEQAEVLLAHFDRGHLVTSMKVVS